MTEFNQQVSAIAREVMENGEPVQVTTRGRAVLRLVPEPPESGDVLDRLTHAGLASAPTQVPMRIRHGKPVTLSAELDDLLSEVNRDANL